MIISASRRTYITAFYSQWFTNRVRAGYCIVPNPSYPDEVSIVSLCQLDVDCFVFRTRHFDSPALLGWDDVGAPPVESSQLRLFEPQAL